MSNTKLALVASTFAATLFSQAAFAGDMSTKAETAETVVTVTATANTAVLSSQANKVRVVDENGNVFYNHFVPKAELPEVDVVDTTASESGTYTIEYEGRIYTNKIAN